VSEDISTRQKFLMQPNPPAIMNAEKRPAARKKKRVLKARKQGNGREPLRNDNLHPTSFPNLDLLHPETPRFSQVYYSGENRVFPVRPARLSSRAAARVSSTRRYRSDMIASWPVSAPTASTAAGLPLPDPSARSTAIFVSPPSSTRMHRCLSIARKRKLRGNCPASLLRCQGPQVNSNS
jgi:hypothetical protein